VATLTEIRTAAADTISAAIAELHPYRNVADAVNTPAFVIAPTSANFLVAMGRGLDTYEFDLTVLVANADVDLAQDLLDQYVNGSGARSIRQAVFQGRTLGRSDCDAHIAGMADYGTRHSAAGVDYLGAVLRLVVHTTGTS
jgi:hypothetical protein